MGENYFRFLTSLLCFVACETLLESSWILIHLVAFSHRAIKAQNIPLRVVNPPENLAQFENNKYIAGNLIAGPLKLGNGLLYSFYTSIYRSKHA